MDRPLQGKVALVAGATRGAGRGIALSLGAAGATVYCTGRSSRAAGPSPMGRPETIEETAELVAAAGGEGVAVRVDHAREAEVEALLQRIGAERGGLDILVNDLWGGDPMVDWSAKFWDQDIAKVRALVDQAVFSHLITARYAAPLLIGRGRGLIVEVTDGSGEGYRGQILYDLVKSSVIRLAYAMAWDLVGTGVTAVALTPGFLRSEVVLESFGVTEANWQGGAAEEPLFAESETPAFIGRVIAAMAADPDVGRFSGLALSSAELGEHYGLQDVDGRRPQVWRHFDRLAEGILAQDGPLDEEKRFFLWASYLRIHRDPASRALAERLFERLGYGEVGEGLRPHAYGGARAAGLDV
jgi:NAD(P)-dependent dehydrogenase (short-subunit alcohol dehydrogenase family)